MFSVILCKVLINEFRFSETIITFIFLINKNTMVTFTFLFIKCVIFKIKYSGMLKYRPTLVFSKLQAFKLFCARNYSFGNVKISDDYFRAKKYN